MGTFIERTVDFALITLSLYFTLDAYSEDKKFLAAAFGAMALLLVKHAS